MCGDVEVFGEVEVLGVWKGAFRIEFRAWDLRGLGGLGRMVRVQGPREV